MGLSLRVFIIEAANWCWCEGLCKGPSTMDKNGRCARCGSEAVAFMDHIQVGSDRGAEGAGKPGE